MPFQGLKLFYVCIMCSLNHVLINACSLNNLFVGFDARVVQVPFNKSGHC